MHRLRHCARYLRKSIIDVSRTNPLFSTYESLPIVDGEVLPG